MKKRRYLTARMPDGYVKTIGPTSHDFTHYWRIVAELENGKSEVFWGHSKNLKEAQRKKAASEDAKKLRGWKSYVFEIVECEESSEPPEGFKTGQNKRR
jgi:DNA topoisomerase IA